MMQGPSDSLHEPLLAVNLRVKMNPQDFSLSNYANELLETSKSTKILILLKIWLLATGAEHATAVIFQLL